MSQAVVAPPLTVVPGKNFWLLSKRWDMVFLIGSVVFVPLPLLIKNGFGLSVTLFNLALSLLVVGPHLFSTFTYTLMERRFWRKHPLYAAGSLAIPPIVIYLGIVHFTLLIVLFLFWASVHALHQIGYLADCYQAKQSSRKGKWLRAIDYAVIFTSLCPIAAYKLVHGSFLVANTAIKIPYVLDNPPVFFLMSALFVVALILYVSKTLWEWKTGHLNPQKALWIGLSIAVVFLLPVPKDLDDAFQGFNAWHSFQYLGLAWWINCLRKERGRIGSPFVQSISGPGKWRAVGFYVSCLAPTLAFFGVIALLTKTSGLQSAQCYFIVALSGLWMHYYFDHWVFTRVRLVVPGKSSFRTTNYGRGR